MILVAALFNLIESGEKYIILSRNEKEFKENLIMAGFAFFFFFFPTFI